MKPFLEEFGLVGSAGQAPITFACSFAVSVLATESFLHLAGAAGATSAPGTPDLLAASDSGASDSDDITNIDTPAFRVGLPPEAIAGDSLRVYRAGSIEIGSAVLNGTDIANGFADVTVTTLPSGGHSISARVENVAGLSPASAGLAITVDIVAPGAPTGIIVAPADQGSGPLQTDNTQPTFRISLPGDAAAGDLVTLEIDTADDAAATIDGADIGNGYVDIQSANTLADDSLYDVSAFLTDVAGNEGASSTAVEIAVGDPSANAVPAVVYDGAQGYLLHTGGPAGAVDGADITICVQCTFNSDGSAMVLAFGDGAVPYLLIRNSDNTIDFIGGTAGAVFSVSTAAVAASLGLVTIIASATGTTATLTVTHASGTITGVNTPGSATDLDLTADLHFGSDDGAGNFLDADVHLLWLDDTYLDAEDPDVIEQFVRTSDNTPRDPGADGSNPLDGDHAPLVCHKNFAATHTVNSGTGGDADTAGSFADGTSPGTWAEDFTPSGIVLEGFTGPVFETDAVDRILTLTYPSGIQAGDVLLVHVVSDWADGWTNDGGFTFLENRDSNPSHAVRHQIWGKVATGAESGTFTFTFNSSAVSIMGGAVLRISGVDVSGGIGTTGGSDGIRDGVTSVHNRSENAPDTSPIGSSITTNTAGAIVLYFECNDGSVNFGSGAPATAVYDADTTLGNDIGMALSYKIQATAGASGTATFTLESAEDWVVTTMALKRA